MHLWQTALGTGHSPVATGVLNATHVLSGRNLRPGAVRNFLLMGTIDVGTEDLCVAIVCYLALRGFTHGTKSDAKEDCNNEVFQAVGALTLGKRAFLIRSFKSFQSVDIR